MEGWPINPLDLVVLAIVLMSGVLALVRGFVREFMSLLTWALATGASAFAFPELQSFWRLQIESPLFADVANMAVSFIVVMIVMTVISHIVSETVKGKVVGSIDRSLGFVFGVLRGFLMICITYLVIGWFLPYDKHPKWVLEAQSQPLLAEGAETIRKMIPEAKFKIGEKGFGFDEAKDAAKDLINPMLLPTGPKETERTKEEKKSGSGRNLSVQ